MRDCTYPFDDRGLELLFRSGGVTNEIKSIGDSKICLIYAITSGQSGAKCCVVSVRGFVQVKMSNNIGKLLKILK